MRTALVKQKKHIIRRSRADYGIFPVMYYYPDYFSDRAEKVYGARLSTCMQVTLGCFPKGKERAILGYTDDYDRLSQSIKYRFLHDKKFISQLDRKSQSIAKSYRKFLNNLIHRHYTYTARQMREAHLQLINYFVEYGFWNTIIWFVAPDLLYEETVKILQESYQLSEQDIQILIHPNVQSCSAVEEMDLLRIGTVLNLNSRSVSKQSKAVQRLLAVHAQRWGYVPWEYMGPNVWSEQDLLDRITTLASSRAAAKKKLLMKKNELRVLQSKQVKLIKKYSINAYHRRLLSDIQTITTMQDVKKDIIGFAQYVFHKVIFAWLSERIGIPPEMCSKYSERELWLGVKNPKKILRTLPERKKAIAGICDRKGTRIIFGKKAKEIYHLFSENLQTSNSIIGKGASKGMVQGVAKVLRSGRDIHKVHAGDILVAPMTTPDYVLAMRKASAIVTDEGGMTSHAAIISRELQIPCVVGTKIATQVLKDGDKVEVDANKGIVKKI